MPQLGAFSISLAVKDIAVSRDFYAKLGFEVVMGEVDQNWMILRNGETTIGLFQGMFDKNTLTFNPGWDGQNQPLDDFQDVREIERELEAAGIELQGRTEGESGPAHCFLLDPDGNPILIDQHV
jgi:catechol 2,3-dioxygenase-like lactoylglutathione lyase family enzyme